MLGRLTIGAALVAAAACHVRDHNELTTPIATERVLHATKLPLLIIRPQKVAASHKQAEVPEEALTSWVGLL